MCPAGWHVPLLCMEGIQCPVRWMLCVREAEGVDHLVCVHVVVQLTAVCVL